MLDRGSTFADDEVVKLVSKRFVPVALDVWYEERRQDAAGDFYRGIVRQRDGYRPGRTTQGFYVATSDGVLVRGWNNRGPARTRQFLLEALASRPATTRDRAATPEGTDAASDRRFARAVPAGGLAVDVRCRILDGQWPGEADRWQRIHRTATGRDHLWILPVEVEALLAGEVPAGLVRRIARFHLVDATRGEPPMWRPDEVERAAMTFVGDEGDVLEGRFVLRTVDGRRSYECALRGEVEREEGRLTRFDLVARGRFIGQGRWTPGAPQGAFTLAVAFALAGDAAAASVPPQGARDLGGYLDAVLSPR